MSRIRWAYLLFAVAAAAAVVAVAGALVVDLSVRDALGSYLLTNVAIGVAFAPCGFLVAEAIVRAREAGLGRSPG